MKRILLNMCMLFLILITATYSYPQHKTTVTDIDGNVYPIVEIGTQKWMGENLKTTKYNNGTSIEFANGVQMDWYNNTSGMYTWYNDDAQNKGVYGALYNWFAATNTNICPVNWHVPTDDEWRTLRDFVGTSEGTKLKATTGWSNDGNGTDDYGFAALPGGYVSSTFSYSNVGIQGLWWTSVEKNTEDANNAELRGNNDWLDIYYHDKGHGLSIRCIKNEGVQEEVASLTTRAVTSITQTTATSGGNVTNNGGAEVTARGVCWSTSPAPTITDSKTEDGAGAGEFTSNLTGLTANTTYYVRAYATNSAGTGYGDEVEFTTSSAPVVPTLTTATISTITQFTATSGGNITDNGGADVTARGVCWSTSPTPTVTDSKTEDGTGVGEFTSNLTGLTASTKYYVRAYATNSVGTGYGNEVVFTTEEETSVDPLPLPFIENFDGELHKWIVIDGDEDGNKWGIYQNSSEVEIAYSGTKCAGVKYNTSGNNDWLITPLLTLPAGEEIEFSFWAKSQDPAYLESFDIQISTDEGVSFTKIGYETDISASYTKYSYDLSGYAGQNVHIAIVCVSVNKFFLYVDDISCATKESTYSPIIPLEFNIIAYPNPFTNNLTIESDKGIRRIVITNINGQVVIQKHINGEISKQINTQKLGSGLYLLQVIDINRKSTHIKLVKP